MAVELKRTNKKVSHFVEEPERDEGATSDINHNFNDNTNEENVSSVSDKSEFEYVVSTAQPLVLGGKKYVFGSVVPEEYVTSFFLKNGHISKRKV